jgi:integrase
LWECLFLTTAEIQQLLTDVEQLALQPCIYPMIVFAAHTGARRSEILRSQAEDVDLLGRTVTIREKKRVRGCNTTRTVPISPALYDVLCQWLAKHSGHGHTFSLGLNVQRSKKDRFNAEPLTRDEAHDHFKRTLAGTKWSPIRGWHVFRHSFCSNCAAAGVDQRVINAWVGHQTEEMVKRYRHLIPNQQQEAITRVFETATTQSN